MRTVVLMILAFAAHAHADITRYAYFSNWSNFMFTNDWWDMQDPVEEVGYLCLRRTSQMSDVPATVVVYHITYSPVKLDPEVAEALSKSNLDAAVFNEALVSPRLIALDKSLPVVIRKWALRLVSDGLDTISVSWPANWSCPDTALAGESHESIT